MTNSPIPALERLIKSKQRVSTHGEVFTPSHTVSKMLDLVKEESRRIDSRFLEPACGEGNFLKEVLLRKLASVQSRYGRNEFERRHYALLSLMCIYGIEIQEDNTVSCRQNLAEIFSKFVNDPSDARWIRAAQTILAVNIVHADALTMQRQDGSAIVFPEWGYLGKGKFQRRDFQYSDLTQRSSFTGTLFEDLETSDIFSPQSNYRPMTIDELGAES